MKCWKLAVKNKELVFIYISPLTYCDTAPFERITRWGSWIPRGLCKNIEWL